MAEIFSIVYSPPGQNSSPPTHYQRVPTTEAKLVAGYGIEGDRKGGNPKRHLNVMTHEILVGLGQEGFKVGPGELGEQIIVAGLDLAALEPGTRVRLGESACIEIVDVRHGCERFEAIQGRPRESAEFRLGVMARVVNSGAIRVGDPVALVAEAVERMA